MYTPPRPSTRTRRRRGIGTKKVAVTMASPAMTRTIRSQEARLCFMNGEGWPDEKGFAKSTAGAPSRRSRGDERTAPATGPEIASPPRPARLRPPRFVARTVPARSADGPHRQAANGPTKVGRSSSRRAPPGGSLCVVVPPAALAPSSASLQPLARAGCSARGRCPRGGLDYRCWLVVVGADGGCEEGGEALPLSPHARTTDEMPPSVSRTKPSAMCPTNPCRVVPRT